MDEELYDLFDDDDADTAELSALYDYSDPDEPEGALDEDVDGDEPVAESVETPPSGQRRRGRRGQESAPSAGDAAAAAAQATIDPMTAKQLRDLQNARAGAQRRAAELERQLNELREQNEETEVRNARQVLIERLRDADPAYLQQKLTEFDTLVQSHRTAQRAEREAEQARTSARETQRVNAATTIASQLGVDPETGQPFVTADELLSYEYQDARQMAHHALQLAGLVDARGNPTQKLAALSTQLKGAQQTQAPQQRQAAAPQGQPARRQAAGFAPPAKRPVTQKRKEPSTMDEGADAFVRAFLKESKKRGGTSTRRRA